MADMMVFGVKFDLQKGVEEALKDGDKALERIEKALSKHPITIKLRMDNKVAKGASTELTGFRKQLAELTQQWNALTAAERGSAAGAAIREKFRALRAEAQGYTSTLQAAVKAEDKMRESQAKTASTSNKLSSAYHNQTTYLSRLIQRMAAYAGVSYVSGFLTHVREVTAEFELQRISLGAIIQDQARANQLFEEIKTFALKSPVKILDLTKYTKQLAAYKIGVDELFDTTKRLTDISVGLGVSMDRIVLMYGQIRATGYLRASEVRQATEAGIPLVEELANKLSKANGELVTAADVMDMISKRAISFDMVKEVFDDMTSAGGIFYNMQEKQGNTLYGMWQKLGDAAAVMYDQIGNTESVNNGMKMTIQMLRYLMLHWKQVGIVISGATVYLVANTVATKNATIATAAATTANQAHIASLNAKLNALRLEQMNLKSVSLAQRLKTAATISGTKTEKASAMSAVLTQRLYTAATISATKAQIGAATSTNVFSKALYGLKAALLSNPLTALAVALTTIIALLMQSESELDKLNSKIQDIDRDYDASGKKSVDRFKELVKAVEENVDGSKAQKEALDELDRTYSKILGSEALELDSLKALGGKYGELIDLIDAYNAKKRGEEKKTAIESTSATIKEEAKDDLMDYLNQAGVSNEKQLEFIARLNEKLIEYSGDADAAIKATNETFKEFADDISQLDAAGNMLNILNPDKLFDAWGVGFRGIGKLFGGKGMDYLYDYANAMQKERELLEENEIATRNAVRGLDEYAEGIDNVGKALKNLDWSSQEALFNSLQEYNRKNPQTALSVPINLEFDPTKAQSEYEKMIEIGNMQIHAIFANLQNIASQEGVAIPEEFYKQAKSVVEGNKSFSFIDFEGLSKLFTSKKAKQAVAESKLLFESISPNDRTAATFRAKLAQLASASGVELSTMTKYFMKAGDNIEDYAKRIKESIEDLEKELKKMRTNNQLIAEGGHGPLQGYSEEEIKEIQMQVAVLKELFPFLQGFTKGGSGGRQSDPRLQNLKEEISLTKKLYDEYHKLEKQIGATKAAEKIQEIYKNTISTLEGRAKKYGFEFELPFTDENLKANMQHFIDKMKELQGLKDKKGKPLFPNIGKEIDEAVAQLEDVDLNSLQKALEKKLKDLADRISRTKTAKEFYEKILSQTGDVELAANVAIHVYGEQGKNLNEQIQKQIETLLEPSGITIDAAVFRADGTFDPKKLRKFAEAQKEALGGIESKAYQELIKLSDNAEKDFAKTIEGWLKAVEKAKGFTDKMLDLARRTRTEIDAITVQKGYAETRVAELLGLGDLDAEQSEELKQLHGFLAIADNLIQGFKDKQAKEQGTLTYEAFKDSPMYVQMFDDLDHASTRMLENMKSRMEGLKKEWNNLTPTQLKEMQSRMNEIDSQLAKRNPFKTLTMAIKKYRDYMKNGEADGGTKSAKEADAKLADAAKVADEARKKYDELVKKYGEGSEKSVQEVIDAKNKLDEAMANEAAAQKAVENWKKVKDAIGLSANELFQMLNWAGDIAKGIADISEAMGADEEDVQYWNDVADALNNISGGIQDIVSAAMSGNVVGIISSTLTAIPKMFVGFTNLFSAGKIKKANKEIKRQQELLDQLEYTYGRLEKAADKLFGADYLQNYNQQLKNLQAQQQAYLKQAQAERSKGKKADKEKIKEYENQARETADAIKELQDDLVAQIVGTDVASAARDFANAWLDAYLSFGSTTDAIKEKFRDMIKHMIVESYLAQAVKNALQPVFDMIDERLADGDLSAQDIVDIQRKYNEAEDDIDNGLRVRMELLKELGLDVESLRNADSGYTGIAKDIAGATSEEINTAAAIGNTIMYHTSHLPIISENVAAMYQLMSQGKTALPDSGSAGWTDWQQQAMDNYKAITRNTADTVVECRRAAVACEAATEKLNRAFRAKGATSGFNVFLNS
jgi:hypothetical protein